MEDKLFDKIRRRMKGPVDYRYYGIQDFSTGYSVKFVVDNFNLLESVFLELSPKHGIRHKNDLRLYFLAEKFLNLREAMPFIVKDEHKVLLERLSMICDSYTQKINNGMIIKYINAHYKYLFNKNKFDLNFIDIVLDFMFKYHSGIKMSVWLHIAKREKYYLLYNFDRIKNFIFCDSGMELFDVLMEIDVDEALFVNNLDNILHILSDILTNHKNTELYAKAKQKVDLTFHALNNRNTELLSDRELFVYNDIFHQFHNFLKDIKDKRILSFSDKVEDIDIKLNKWLKTSGSKLTYEVPIGEFLKEWRNIKDWVLKLLYLTHDTYIEKNAIKVKSRLDDHNNEKHIMDFCSSNINTNEYFTASSQLSLQFLSVNSSGFLCLVFKNDDDYEQYCRLILSAIYHIKSNSRLSRSKSLAKDSEMIYNYLETFRYNLENDCVEFFLFGFAMFLCALSEKLLKIVYEDITRDKQYVSIDSLSLGSLLDTCREDNPLIDIFGEDHLKNLSFFFCKIGFERVGYGLRNSLAHLSDNIEERLNLNLVYQILWLFTDIVGTVLWFYIEPKIKQKL